MRRRAIGALLVAALVITSASAAAAADATSAKRWATSTCGALGRWESSIAARAKPTKEQADPKTGRAVLSKYVRGIVKDTKTLVKRLDAAGFPDVDQGEQIAAAIHAAFTDALATLRAAKGQVAELDVSSAATFSSGATAIQQSIADAFGAAQSTLSQAGEQYSVPALTSALSNARSCQALVASP
jgi:hypothetical protein